jgi:hypothetical protein
VSPVESVMGKGRSSTSAAFTVLLCIFLVPVLGWFFSGSFTGEFSSWTSLLVMGGLLFMLHQARGNVTPVVPGTPDTPAPAMPTMPLPTEPPAASVTTPLAMPTATMPPPVGPPVTAPPPVEDRTTPPAWDPLGAAPFAWDLPEPSLPEPEEPAPPPAKRRKPRVAMATIGLGLVTVAALSLGEGGWINEEHIVGVALAIIAFGLVAGSFLRAGRSLILLAVPLSLAGLAMTSEVNGGGYQGFGNIGVTPARVENVRPLYERSVGDINLNLANLPATGEVYTEARTDIGNVIVTVPATADVTVSCSSDVGSVTCLGESQNGPDAHVEQYTDYGTDGLGGLKVQMWVYSSTGNVEVRRG